MVYDQFILFGDSITQGSFALQGGFAFGPALQDVYIRRLDVINRGFNGYNTAQALQVLPQIIPSPDQARIRLMTIFFGANDAAAPLPHPTVPNQHVPLPAYTRNLRRLIEHPALAAHRPALLLITPPPIDEHAQAAVDEGQGFPGPRRTAAAAKQYRDAVLDLAAALGLPVVDLWAACMTLTDWRPETSDESTPLPGSRARPQDPVLQRVLTDGLHLGPLGYQYLFDELMRVLRKAYPELAPESLEPVFPPWDRVGYWEKVVRKEDVEGEKEEEEEEEE